MPSTRNTDTTPELQGDEDQLFREHDDRFRRALRHRYGRVNADHVDEACNEAWAIMVRSQPRRETVFAWLFTVARFELWRILNRRSRETLTDWADLPEPAGRDDHDAYIAVLDALTAVAALPAKQRRFIELRVAGHSYRDIATAEDVTYTNVNKHLAKARATLARSHD